MPYLLGILGNLLFSLGLQVLTIFARTAAINVAIAAAATVALGVALTVFLNIVASYVGQLLTAAQGIPAIPYFLPSNLTYCLSAYAAVTLGGSVFNMVVNWINSRAYILKA